MKKIALHFFALASLFSAVGCADTQTGRNDPNRTSPIPWNRPEKWEGTGALGGMINANQ